MCLSLFFHIENMLSFVSYNSHLHALKYTPPTTPHISFSLTLHPTHDSRSYMNIKSRTLIHSKTHKLGFYKHMHDRAHSLAELFFLQRTKIPGQLKKNWKKAKLLNRENKSVWQWMECAVCFFFLGQDEWFSHSNELNHFYSHTCFRRCFYFLWCKQRKKNDAAEEKKRIQTTINKRASHHQFSNAIHLLPWSLIIWR